MADEKKDKVFNPDVRGFSWHLADMTDRHRHYVETGIDVFERLAVIRRIHDPDGKKALERLRRSLI